MTDVFGFFTKIWLSLSYSVRPFFEWFVTPLELGGDIVFAPYELAFGLGVMVLLTTWLFKMFSPLG